eukprot:CAMPEP_0171291724 /NCGR_PEP_ID=MMETSP0790-20130122/71796_1 /TAXON_ID=2925 /ORGANISM="Alexandrium catenella, Strain OF101" /LENGTH=644 /DNA_ID=CAMNT_0011761449 /DNA_START=66 /DNA_END=2000 /DNA_ORIENTATION=+
MAQLPPMSPMYEDLAEEIFYGQQAYNYIQQKDIAVTAEDMTGHCTFVIDWFQENLPLEDKDGTSLDGEVRKMIAASCHKTDVAPTPKEEPPKKEDVLVFADQAGLCMKVLEGVPGDRIATKKVVTKPPALLTVEDIETMLGTKEWDCIIIGCSLDPAKSSSVADIIGQQNAVMHFLLRLLQACFKKEGCCKRMCMLSHDIFSCEEETNKERGLAGVTNSTLYGFCNTARLEMEFPIALIDTELVDDDIMVPYIATEIFRACTFGVNTVRLCYPFPVKNGIATGRPAGRFVVRQLPSYTYQVANREFELPAEGVIGISGGNGALALVMGEWLLNKAETLQAQSGGAYVPKFSIEFLSRSMKISDLNMGRWKGIEARAASMGIHVEQAKLDMGSQESCDKWFSSHSPNVIGFIHSAGILQDSMLPNQTWEKFEGVYDGKHRAALYIHDSLERIANPNLKFLWFFSSTSVYGNMGQLNYSSSNSFMDGLARWRRSQGKPACAIQWGAWGEVGMAATMDDAMRRRVMMGPMPYFTVSQGLEGLDGGLRTNLPGFSVFIVNPPMMFGMIQSDQSTTACATRNFSCEYVPPPAPQWFAHESTYNIYRMYRYIMDPYSASGSEYYWGKFVRPMIKDEEEAEENPFVEHAMF